METKDAQTAVQLKQFEEELDDFREVLEVVSDSLMNADDDAEAGLGVLLDGVSKRLGMDEREDEHDLLGRLDCVSVRTCFAGDALVALVELLNGRVVTPRQPGIVASIEGIARRLKQIKATVDGEDTAAEVAA